MKPKLTKREASAYILAEHGLTVSPRTLDNLAWAGNGPKFYKAGLRRLYSPRDLDAYAIAKLGEPRTSTSDRPRPGVVASVE
jgi:hypothetical protein